MHKKLIPFNGQNAANREMGKKRGKKKKVARPLVPITPREAGATPRGGSLGLP